MKEWDNGYLVVMAKYEHNDKEEYIDLIPILNDLYFDIDEFLRPIKKVRVLNLNNPEKSVFMDNRERVLETSMDDIEIQIVKSYLEKEREEA